MKFNNVLELIGNSPLVNLSRLNKEKGTNIYAKIEKTNLTGSIKDRACLQMILDAFESGLLKERYTIIEPTSGNTGISLAALSNYFSLKCIIVMPKSMSIERRKLIQSFNAQLVLVDGGMKECVDRALQIQKDTKNSVILGQFDNFSNVKAHYYHTIKEIINDLPEVDVIVAGIGTGGTITGIGKYVKEKNLNIEIVGVKPEKVTHKIQGIGPNFTPSILDENYIDRFMYVSDESAINNARKVLQTDALLVGISSGAVLSACIMLCEDEAYKNKKIVAIFPDTGERYSWE